MKRKRYSGELWDPPTCRDVAEEEEHKMRLRQLSVELEGTARSMLS